MFYCKRKIRKENSKQEFFPSMFPSNSLINPRRIYHLSHKAIPIRCLINLQMIANNRLKYITNFFNKANHTNGYKPFFVLGVQLHDQPCTQSDQ